MSATLSVAQHTCALKLSKSHSASSVRAPATASLSASKSMMAGTALKSTVRMNSNKVTLGRTSVVTTECKVKGLAQLMNKIELAEMKPKEDLIEFKIGHEVKVGVTVTEGDKTRVQNYQGTIIAMHKNGVNTAVTVRKVVQGVGVERTFPIHSPLLTFEDVPGSGTPKVRRAKLYYLRNLKGKKAKLKRKF